MRRAGYTLVEMVLCIALTAIVVGILATLYGFATVHLSDAYQRTSLADQANSVADRIESTIRNATVCGLDPNGNLVCLMPLKGVDTDGDGYFDTYYPDKTDSLGGELYSAGRLVWFYNAGPTGSFGNGSGNVWRAEMSALGNPTSSSVDQSFAYYYGGSLRYPLVFSGTYTVAAATHSVTFSVVASIPTKNSGGSPAISPTWNVTVTRTVTWRL